MSQFLARRPVEAPRCLVVIEAVEAMAEGAVGLSTGLEYVPGTYAPAGEVIALARAAAARQDPVNTRANLCTASSVSSQRKKVTQLMQQPLLVTLARLCLRFP